MRKVYLFFLSLIISNFLFAQWITDPVNGGTVISNATSSENYQVSVTDGSNGAVVVFEAGDDNGKSDIYAQRINNNGQILWGTTNNAKPVCIHAANKYIENVISDGSGGIFIAWSDYRNNTDTNDLYIQHLNSNGDPLFSLNGIQVNHINDGDAYEIRLCSDGSGGVIVTWTESLEDEELITFYSQIFAQKYTSSGTAQWGDGGLQICYAPGLRADPSIISDGSGGAIISFSDSRNDVPTEEGDFTNIDIYAQRISSAGELLWADDGAAVNTQPFHQIIEDDYYQINASVPDGTGGVILLFNDYTGDNDGNGNLYVQHLNAAGVMQWGPAGSSVATSTALKILTKLVSDGAGGILAFWGEDRAGSGVYAGYAQRVLANGSVNWTANGIKLVDNIGSYSVYSNDLTNDGNGSYIFSWTDEAYNLKAQKINGSGAIQWGAAGKDICTNPNASPVLPAVVKSDAGSTIISWLDNRNFTNSSSDIYAAKIDATGTLLGLPAANLYITVANGNWNVGATWQGGVVPPVTADVFVRHVVAVTANAGCHSVKVEKPNGNLTVNTGINLSILE